MASLEKLIKTIDQLRLYEISTADAKKKELRQHLSHLVEFTCSPAVQGHKDFANHIGPTIDTLIKFCDSKDSNIRLASDEGLYMVIKALVPIHSNRVLVEFCKQIKKTDSSPRVLKLCLSRFADLCHHARPQKRRAYLANLLNAISTLGARSEETVHESLASFCQKVFGVMGIFAYENESKALMKVFLTNLASKSSIIRRSAAVTVTAIISTSRKSEMLLALVLEYLTDQILIPEGHRTVEAGLIIGTLLTLKMLLPLFPSTLLNAKVNHQAVGANFVRPFKPMANLHSVAVERIIQIFELGVHYSMHQSDHNVVNAALEVLQQLLKMRNVLLAIPALKCLGGLQGTRISPRGLLKPAGQQQWNVTPLPVAEESHLHEPEVSLSAFGEFNSEEAYETEAETSEVDSAAHSARMGLSKSLLISDVDIPDAEETKERIENNTEVEESETSFSDCTQSIDIGSVYATKQSALLHCARHLAHHFLLSDRKGQLKSDRQVRVSVKSLALNCLVHVGSLEPLTWDSLLCDASHESIAVLDVLAYHTHDDPQLRGQIGLLACAILGSIYGGFRVTSVEAKTLIAIINETLADKETSACRLALQGLQALLPVAIESPFCLEIIPLLQSLVRLSDNPYWLVRVDLLEVFASLPWPALEFALRAEVRFNFSVFQRAFLDRVVWQLIDDEDHRTRSAVAECLTRTVSSWTTLHNSPDIVRVKCLMFAFNATDALEPGTFCGVLLPIHGLADAYHDVRVHDTIAQSLAFFVNELTSLLVTSSSKFVKMGCLQSLASLSCSYPPVGYSEAYGCQTNNICGLLKLVVALVTNSTLMLDLPTHQALLSLATRLFAGCVKKGVGEPESDANADQRDWQFLNIPLATLASSLLAHVSRILNAFAVILEDVNPQMNTLKTPLVNLPNPSALSPIRRKMSKTSDSFTAEKDEKPEELGRRWSKPSQLLNPSNLGFFVSQPLYMRLYDLLKATLSTCKLNFDTTTSERLSAFLQATLETLSTLLEVAVFQDIGKHSEEILNYLRLIINVEPVHSLLNVQQLLKSLFGTNLAAVWHSEFHRHKRASTADQMSPQSHRAETFYSSSGIRNEKTVPRKSPGKSKINTSRDKVNLIVKFHTSVGRVGADKVALSSYIRLFEPMVIRALKLYTVTSSPQVQKVSLDLLCELIHLCVNYCLLDADQVFLNFVIQQFEFLEEGFIPQVEILLPSMFRFLSLLSYDRYHSKTIIGVPRIMQLSGGLMATGKDAQQYVLPTLGPMVEDLFLSKERMDDNFNELETQREVLINILLRLVQYHQVYPLLGAILVQVQSESAIKWKSLSKQVLDVLLPQFQKYSLMLDSPESLRMLHKLLSLLDPPMVHESLLGLLQTFSSAASEDPESFTLTGYHRVLACRLAVLEALISVFDEAFLLDCLSEFNLGYLVNQNSDPLNVTPTENPPADRIFSSLIIDTLKSALKHWKSRSTADASWPSQTTWRVDHNSFPLHLVIDYIRLVRQLLNSEHFPVMQATVRVSLKQDDCKNLLFDISSSLIPTNPMVFVRVCDLLSTELDGVVSLSDTWKLSGLNQHIARSGLFVIRCHEMLDKDQDRIADFVHSDFNFVLYHIDAPPVKQLVARLSGKSSCVDQFLDNVLKMNRTLEATLLGNFFKFLCLLEGFHSEEVLLKILSRTEAAPIRIIQHKLLELMLNKKSFSTDFPNKFMETLPDCSNKKFYARLGWISREGGLGNRENLTAIDKSFVLGFASHRIQTKPAMWQRVASQLEAADLARLLVNDECLNWVLCNCRSIKPTLFASAKTWLFQQFINNPRSLGPDQLSLVARIVIQLMNSIPKSEMKHTFSLTELVLLAKLPFAVLVAAVGAKCPFLFLHASSKVIQKLGSMLIAEWAKPENLPFVYETVDALELLLATLNNVVTLPKPVFSGFEQVSHLDSSFTERAQRLSRLLTSLERGFNHVPETLHCDIQDVILAFCQLPVFYSYVIIPPSAWGKDWKPTFELDAAKSVFHLPVIPTSNLHDEVIMQEFVYRIEKIGWTTRQKFEEIWMSFLGILSLNSGEVRAEEEASVVQATCEAVRSLTMILKKNLPFSSLDSNKCVPPTSFMQTERGEKLNEILSLLESSRATKGGSRFNYLSFHHIYANLEPASPSKKKSISPDDVSQIDVQSCVRFLVDLYAQWFQTTDTSYPLLVEIFRSLLHISDFFTEVQQFEWMLQSGLHLCKQILPDDPACLETVVTGCIFKAAAFAPMNTDTWEQVKKHLEISLNSQHVAMRASGLGGLLYLLQRFTRNPDTTRSSSSVGLAMDYIAEYLGSDNMGPDWHQSWLWSLAFYSGEHFPESPFRSRSVIDFVVQCALNGLLENKNESIAIQHEILQGLEHLCILDRLPTNWRKLVKKEVINIIRNVERDSILQPALRTLLTLVYSDFANQLYKPGTDPETMLVAMEWVGALFQRMKRGTDEEAEILGRIMPIIACDIFPPADILNRVLIEFMSSRPSVAYHLTPTVFRVFASARSQGQQSLVVEWILLSLSNFTQASFEPPESEYVAVWNIFTFFTAASENPWLQSIFPLVGYPVNHNDAEEIRVFVASALDFASQLNGKQRSNLVSVFKGATNPFYAAVDAALHRV